MAAYPVEVYGLLLDTAWYSDDDVRKMFEDEVCDCFAKFTGSATFVDDPPFNIQFVREPIYFIALENQPSLFNKAYEDMDAVVAEIKNKLGKYMDSGFNIVSSIVHISGFAN